MLLRPSVNNKCSALEKFDFIRFPFSPMKKIFLTAFLVTVDLLIFSCDFVYNDLVDIASLFSNEEHTHLFK